MDVVYLEAGLDLNQFIKISDLNREFD